MDYFVRVEEWFDYLVRHGRKQTTITGYRNCMSRCLRTLYEAGFPTDPESIGEEEITFLKNILEMKEDTVRHYLRILGYWLEWATGENAVKEADLLWNECEIRRVFITSDELKVLLANAGVRERLILLLGSRMGLRRAEILSIKLTDIKDGRLTIHGKGHGPQGKVVNRKMPQPVLDALDEWMQERDRVAQILKDESDGALIVAYGHKGYMSKMSLGCLSHLIRELGRLCGIEVTTHSLRRFFATNLRDHGAELDEVKMLLRHENVNTTINCYLAPNTSRLEALAEEASEF